ncbi:MAG: nucleotidyl transferase AbiEii/AbiGii toxin family protein [Bacteroidales bacterium]
MIQKNCISNKWISEISSANKADKVLVQKLIRALILLEGLSESKIKFVFKGGTALMLLLNSTKRLSIDIDIIISEKYEDLKQLLSDIAIQKGFTRVEEKQRKVLSGIAKAHYKFYFPCSLKTDNEEFVLLDILFEDNHYSNLISTPIQSSFITQEGEILQTTTPDFNNIMGDKLTAFAPNTTGIPYFKKEKPMGQEIIKQLYDIGNIFEKIDDIAIIKEVFINFAKVELKYRNLGDDENIVLDDIVENCLSISLRQIIGKSNYEVLQSGLKQISNYIFSEKYYIEKATIHAARTAYLIALMQTGTPIHRYNNIDMSDWIIEQPGNTKLNKLKKTNPEAFYYWFQYYSLK